MMQIETQTNKYLGGDTSMNVSAGMAEQVDREALDIIKLAHEKAIAILDENREKLHELSHHLLIRDHYRCGIHEDIGSITARIRGTDSSELPICQQKKAVWLSQFEIATLLIDFRAQNVRVGLGLCSACRILCGYQTTSEPNAVRLSDTLRLSDKHCTKCDADVGYYAVIRQVAHQMRCGCRMLARVVRFFPVIGQAQQPNHLRSNPDMKKHIQVPVSTK